MYIGRGSVCNVITPGKIHPSHRRCYVPYDGLEHSLKAYEVLVLPAAPWYEWVPSNILLPLPENAIAASEDLYVCRTKVIQDMVPGKFSPSMQKAWVSYGCKEHEVEVRSFSIRFQTSELFFFVGI